jgi:hypothetical protein
MKEEQIFAVQIGHYSRKGNFTSQITVFVKSKTMNKYDVEKHYTDRYAGFDVLVTLVGEVIEELEIPVVEKPAVPHQPPQTDIIQKTKHIADIDVTYTEEEREQIKEVWALDKELQRVTKTLKKSIRKRYMALDYIHYVSLEDIVLVGNFSYDALIKKAQLNFEVIEQCQ